MHFRSSKLSCTAITLTVLSALLMIAIQPAHAQTETVLYSFGGIGGDALNPYAGLTINLKSKNGILYGTTYAGGAYGYGSIFKVDPVAQVEEVLYSFTGGADGAYPEGSGVVRDVAGNLYGTTYGGGANNIGTVFKLATDGTETVLHSFASDGVDGYEPFDGLVLDKAGNLYGTTYVGGAIGYGTVFKITPSGTETILYNFAGGTDGCYPYGESLVLGKKNVLYGTTSSCGANGYGTVFELTQSGVETVLHSFAADGVDGIYPYAGVALDKAGNVYGTTLQGGANGVGTVFKVATNGTETILHNFIYDGTDGAYPWGAPVLDKLGNIYGTTYQGGVNNYGAVFKLNKSGTETVLHSFANNGDGAYPVFDGVALGKKSVLYGTTYGGGAYGGGTVYSVKP